MDNDARTKLKNKLLQKKLGRQTKFTRNNMMIKLEDLLKEAKDSETRNKLQNKINILEDVEENEFAASMNNDSTNDSSTTD